MAPEERGPDTGVFLPEDCSELGMTDRADGLNAPYGNGYHVAEVSMEEPGEKENASKALETSSQVPEAKNYVGSMAIVTFRTPGADLLENTAVASENMGLVPHGTSRFSIQALKEKLKDKLKEKLKPKLRLNHFKHRQESSSQVIPWILTEEVSPPQQNGEAHVAHYDQLRPLVSDVAPLKMMLPVGVKTEAEQEGPLDAPSPFFSLGREPSGQQLVVANVSNGRKRSGNKSTALTRVNRFADSILQFIGERSVPEKLIRGALGNNPDISKAIRLLLQEKRLKRLGDGGKGCAYVYVRTDLGDIKPKTKELEQVDLNAQALNIEREFVRELERRFPATNKLDSSVWNRCERMQGDHLQCDV